MKYVVSIHAYDCLDQVNYTCAVREYADYEHAAGETVAVFGGSIPGKGHEFWPHWLADVLGAMLEDL